MGPFAPHKACWYWPFFFTCPFLRVAFHRYRCRPCLCHCVLLCVVALSLLSFFALVNLPIRSSSLFPFSLRALLSLLPFCISHTCMRMQCCFTKGVHVNKKPLQEIPRSWNLRCICLSLFSAHLPTVTSGFCLDLAVTSSPFSALTVCHSSLRAASSKRVCTRGSPHTSMNMPALVDMFMHDIFQRMLLVCRCNL